jgi:chromosome partitioning protein
LSRFIAIANQKGGVGKTTTTVNLGASLAELGQRVLILDMDPQGNASSGFGVAANTLDRGIYEVLMGSIPIEEAVCSQVSPGVDLLPSGQRLIGAEVELVATLARERVLEKWLQPLRDKYDILIADCPPSLGLLTVNTLTAADTVLIPIQCEYYALEGLTQLLNTIRLIQQALNPRLDIEGILLTMFDARLNLSREVAEEARKFFPGRVYDTVIPRNVRLSEAPSFGKPVIQYDRECAGAQFYLRLAGEVLGQTNGSAAVGAADEAVEELAEAVPAPMEEAPETALAPPEEALARPEEVVESAPAEDVAVPVAETEAVTESSQPASPEELTQPVVAEAFEPAATEEPPPAAFEEAPEQPAFDPLAPHEGLTLVEEEVAEDLPGVVAYSETAENLPAVHAQEEPAVHAQEESAVDLSPPQDEPAAHSTITDTSPHAITLPEPDVAHREELVSHE